MVSLQQAWNTFFFSYHKYNILMPPLCPHLQEVESRLSARIMLLESQAFNAEQKATKVIWSLHSRSPDGAAPPLCALTPSQPTALLPPDAVASSNASTKPRQRRMPTRRAKSAS